MLENCIAILSYKGGNGKTLLTANIAYSLAKRGEKVLVLDFDHLSGNLAQYFSINPFSSLNRTINNVFHLCTKVKEYNQLAEDFSSLIYKNVIKINGKSQNGTIDFLPAIGTTLGGSIASLDSQEMKIDSKAQEKINLVGIDWRSVAKVLFPALGSIQDDFNYNWVIIDNQPSFVPSAVVALVLADKVLVVTLVDRIGIQETVNIFRHPSMQNYIKKKDVYAILNRFIEGTEVQPYYQKATHALEENGIKILDKIPCLCPIGSGEWAGPNIASKEPDSLFSKSLEAILNGLLDKNPS